MVQFRKSGEPGPPRLKLGMLLALGLLKYNTSTLKARSIAGLVFQKVCSATSARANKRDHYSYPNASKRPAPPWRRGPLARARARALSKMKNAQVAHLCFFFFAQFNPPGCSFITPMESGTIHQTPKNFFSDRITTSRSSPPNIALGAIGESIPVLASC